ncbi:MAG: Asp23/Gls24 family envelope stress response protein [Bacillota bacterium]|nr:Asp23/Gls24 family envelope stress response protein [Bacillota bacterium]
MGKQIITQYGLIDISKEVIATLAGIAAMECFGVVGMVSSRVFSDGISEILGRDMYHKGVDVMVGKENELIIRVNVVVGYGIRMSVIAENVMERVKYTVQKFTGETVKSVDVKIQGVKIVD